MEIDLADLIDEPVPRNRMILCPFHDENDAQHAHLPGSLLLLRLRRVRRSRRLADAGRGPGIRRGAATCSTTGTARSFRDRTCDDDDEDDERTARALKLWDAAKPIAGTLAARYLAEVRGIDLDALPADIDDALRFHPHCPFGPGTRHPCLLALMRDAVSNAADRHSAHRADRRCPQDRPHDARPRGVVKLWPAGKQLVIGEGLETMLAAATRLPYRGEPLRPAWAMLSNGAP